MEETAKKNIVLVHGVWIDGSSWAEVIKLLAHQGHKVYAAQLPLNSFEDDVATVHRLLHHVDGPVILVGHSYGGAVISAAGNHKNVEKLVYITAFAPDPKQVFGSILGINPPAASLNLAPDADGYLWIDAPTMQDAIAHDVHRGLVNLAVAVQNPYHVKLFEASIPDPAWQHKPSYYLVTSDDRILNPLTQRAMAEKIGATVKEVASSHLPLVSQPQAVADIIHEAAA